MYAKSSGRPSLSPHYLSFHPVLESFAAANCDRGLLLTFFVRSHQHWKTTNQQTKIEVRCSSKGDATVLRVMFEWFGRVEQKYAFIHETVVAPIDQASLLLPLVFAVTRSFMDSVPELKPRDGERSTRETVDARKTIIYSNRYLRYGRVRHQHTATKPGKGDTLYEGAGQRGERGVH